MCFIVDETADVYQQDIRKARKTHRCEGCGKLIHAGELYAYAHGIFDGHSFDVKTCGACDATIHRIHEHELSEGCHWVESWCPVDELRDYCNESGFKMSTQEEGQKFLAERKKKLKKPAPQVLCGTP